MLSIQESSLYLIRKPWFLELEIPDRENNANENGWELGWTWKWLGAPEQKSHLPHPLDQHPATGPRQPTSDQLGSFSLKEHRLASHPPFLWSGSSIWETPSLRKIYYSNYPCQAIWDLVCIMDHFGHCASPYWTRLQMVLEKEEFLNTVLLWI